MRRNSVKDRIFNYTRDKYYFHIGEIREHLNVHNFIYTDENLKKTLYRMTKDEMIFDAGRGWYSLIKKQFDLDKRPVEKLLASVEKNMPFLEFCCWSTEQLKAYFHHLQSQFVTFAYTEKDFLGALKDQLETLEYTVFLNPLKSEAEKFVHFQDRAVILRPSIKSREPKEKHYARIEKIIVDLYVERTRINLIDEEEYKRIIGSILPNFRINLADMLEYAERRGIKQKIASFVH